MKIFFKFHLFKEFLFLSHCVYPNKSNESFLQISSFYEFLFLSFNIHTNEMKVFMQYKIYCFVQECCWVINQLPNRPWPVAIHQDISEFNIPLAQKYFSTMNKKKKNQNSFPLLQIYNPVSKRLRHLFDKFIIIPASTQLKKVAS